jgi:hypothetical protein
VSCELTRSSSPLDTSVPTGYVRTYVIAVRHTCDELVTKYDTYRLTQEAHEARNMLLCDNYTRLDNRTSARVLVNQTSAGMHRSVGVCRRSWQHL